MRPCIIWGGTGQAKVVRPILEEAGHKLLGVFDNDPALASPFDDVALFGGQAAFDTRRHELPPGCGFVVAIGGAWGAVRCEVSAMLEGAGLVPLSAVHRRSFVAETARLGRGCQILAMAAISEEAVLGDYCIINTSASVDHECRLGVGVHVMPGASIAGSVEIGDLAMVGTNATVLPRIKIGAGAIVGAGAVVTRNVADGATVLGVPARPRRRDATCS